MKSHVSKLTSVAQLVYHDACAKCTANPPESRDLKTITTRIKNEGLSFLTITLPSLGSDLEKALEQGGITPDLFRSFKKRLKAPAFLRGFFEQIFDTGNGELLNEPSIEAIEGVRQIAYTFKKVSLQCTPERVSHAMEKFIECEQDLKEPIPESDRSTFEHVCNVLWGSILPNYFNYEDIIPKHGPGATAERVFGNSKYRIRRWHERLEKHFPFLQYGYNSYKAMESGYFAKVVLVPEEEEQPVRVVTVPKTLKGPRVIAIEPVCMQYAQQGLSRALIKCLTSNPLTGGHILFDDQSVNRSLALAASKDLSLATLDLSSASDRVPLSLASMMLDSVPDFRDAVLACRSKRAQLPSGDTISLLKFASMGSALCFPIEAMYFYTICIIGLLESKGLPYTYDNIKLLSKCVYVYGDDIIVPVNSAVYIINALQRYYCKVNTAKSFWTGRFRESCGMDAYNGEEVTPTYIRRMPPNDVRSAQELISWVETSNLFYKKGYWKTAAYMRDACRNILGKLPIIGEQSQGLGFYSYQCHDSIKPKGLPNNLPTKKLNVGRLRWNVDYQAIEVMTWVVVPKRQRDAIGGYPALMKCLLQLERKDDTDPSDSLLYTLDNRGRNTMKYLTTGHLRETVRRGSVALKIQWVRPY